MFNLQTAIGESEIFHTMMDKVSHLAKINRSILILGERGTGKEIVALRLHYLSPRWREQFVSVNCAALSDTLLDAELFGSEKGSFTNSNQKRLGRIERAHNGTLFLDEIANASMQTQEKLLRVIEYGELERIGGQKTIQVNVRFVAATNADLRQRIKEGRFLPDLLDRLCFDTIKVPALRERGDDILLLANHYAQKFLVETKIADFFSWSENAKYSLKKHHWPGNIRELKNTIERTLYFHDDFSNEISSIAFEESPPSQDEVISPASHQSIPRSSNNFTYNVEQYEKTLVLEALEICKFNQRNTAKYLELTYHQLRGLLKKHQIKAHDN